MALLCATAAVALLLIWAQDPILAQAARHPFAVGGNEGASAATGLAGAIIAWQNKFHLQLQQAVAALKTDRSAFWALSLASFAYGVFHAAGPGHGKAVLASYMIANERALRRGLLLAGFAALLQGAVAIAIVGAAALLFNATAKHMSDAASYLETFSYVAIAGLGARLVWVKSRALLAAVQAAPAAAPVSGRFNCEAIDPTHVYGPDCGHLHAPDPAALGGAFSWPDAIATVVAAGARPCSGSILVLVFALSKGLFLAGVTATLLISAGTAITTGAIAAFAVFAKDAAAKLGRSESRNALLFGRGAELCAAFLVLALGLILLVGAGASQGAV